MDNDAVQVLQGKHANSKVYNLGDGFLYFCYKNTDFSSYYRCSKFRTCPARAIHKWSGCLTFTGHHNHVSGPNDQVLYRAERLSLLNQARCLNEATLGDVFNNPRNADLLYQELLTLRRLGPAMTRARTSALPKCESLSHLSAVLNNPNFACVTASSQFEEIFFKGSAVANDNSHVILFMSRLNSEFLKLQSSVFLLQISVLIGVHHYQVCTLVGETDHGKVWPLAWILLEEMGSYEAFLAAFTLLKTSLISHNFQQAISGSDLMAKAFSTVFSVNVFPSLYDFISEIQRCDIGFTPQSLNGNKPLKHIISLCCALPLLPKEHLQIGINVVKAEALKYGGMTYLDCIPLFAFIEEKWLNVPQRQFLVSGNIDRTDYSCEELRHKINHKIGRCNADLYSILRYIVFSCQQTSSAATANRQPLLHMGDVVQLLKDVITPPFTIQLATRNFLVNISNKFGHILI